MPEADPSLVPDDAFGEPGAFLASVKPEDLVYFCLNEGDGDSQLILGPQISAGPRQAVVIDVASPNKLSALVKALAGQDPDQALGPPLLSNPPLLPLVVATHPHDDHIQGMGDFLSRYGDHVKVFWEPGYRHPTPAYQRMMGELRLLPEMWHVQPTAGTTTWIGQMKLTALSPAIGLRNQFDSYGVDINDSSISMRIEFPASAVVERVTEGKKELEYLPPPQRAAMVLGADSQALSWARVLVDFPYLEPSLSPIAEALGKAGGANLLSAPIFKVSHHSSNRGSFLELIQKINPKVCLVTADPQGSHHGFPHAVALEGIREAMEPVATTKKPRTTPDHNLGVHVTGARYADGQPVGSIALVVRPGVRNDATLWRFGDAASEALVLDRGRRSR